jgi:hypothetical protein
LTAVPVGSTCACTVTTCPTSALAAQGGNLVSSGQVFGAVAGDGVLSTIV